MAWNEPGKGGKQPWKSGGGNDEIEAFVQRLKDNLGRMFGGGGRRGGGVGGGMLGWLLLIALVWLSLDSWQMIDERQRGVVLRFGKFDRLMDPGPNFKWPRPIESVYKVNVTDVRSFTDRVRLLTRDENIVQISFAVQFMVADPRDYLFGTREPEDTLHQAAESALRDVIGSSEMDTLLTGERALLASEAKRRLQATLDSYRTGLQVTVLTLDDARAPQEVQQAFDDAISAREDKNRIENEAQAYASKVLPEARGRAARIRAEAEGYRQAKIARAQGDADRFRQLVEEYRKAPDITRRRLYLETMEQVLGDNRKVYAGDGGNVLYLPLGGEGQSPLPPNSPAGRIPAASAAQPSGATPELPRDPRAPRRGREGDR